MKCTHRGGGGDGRVGYNCKTLPTGITKRGRHANPPQLRLPALVVCGRLALTYLRMRICTPASLLMHFYVLRPPYDAIIVMLATANRQQDTSC